MPNVWRFNICFFFIDEIPQITKTPMHSCNKIHNNIINCKNKKNNKLYNCNIETVKIKMIFQPRKKEIVFGEKAGT